MTLYSKDTDFSGLIPINWQMSRHQQNLFLCVQFRPGAQNIEKERKTILEKHEIMRSTRPQGTKYTIQILLFREIKDYSINYKKDERCQFLCFTILPNTVLIKYFVMTAFCLKILSTVIRKGMKYVFVRKALEAWKETQDLKQETLIWSHPDFDLGEIS